MVVTKIKYVKINQGWSMNLKNISVILVSALIVFPTNSEAAKKRGGKGVINMKTTAKTGKVVASFPVDQDSEVIIITQQAKLIRLDVDKIRKTGRSAQGVMLIRTGTDDLVTSASLIEPQVDAELGEIDE